jgi:hypothetical protein
MAGPLRGLSDRTFGGQRRLPLVIAGCGSALCSVTIAYTGAGASALRLTLLSLVFGFVGIGWNGVQHTLMAELAGARSAGTALGLGLAVSSLGVTIGPPIFGACVEWAGGFRGPWIGLAVTMAAALLLGWCVSGPDSPEGRISTARVGYGIRSPPPAGGENPLRSRADGELVHEPRDVADQREVERVFAEAGDQAREGRGLGEEAGHLAGGPRRLFDERPLDAVGIAGVANADPQQQRQARLGQVVVDDDGLGHLLVRYDHHGVLERPHARRAPAHVHHVALHGVGDLHVVAHPNGPVHEGHRRRFESVSWSASATARPPTPRAVRIGVMWIREY